jgi:hypothetical protein
MCTRTGIIYQSVKGRNPPNGDVLASDGSIPLVLLYFLFWKKSFDKIGPLLRLTNSLKVDRKWVSIRLNRRKRKRGNKKWLWKMREREGVRKMEWERVTEIVYVCMWERDRERERGEGIWYSFKMLTSRWSPTIEKVGNTSLC